ncbi:hypothetical protein SP15_203 [Bacillus phage SP-15]|uniref:Uncharacterized protein n=1 Tax=Bacillus phage SP-15 TaxID=1792032 RepID=A0A127AWN6_9CAUD|nr:hypothetical protein SP15_203 [Bacillus phage SP-15]AMM45003.1 hypothetical protein SP15_203 [Bacillus phage SP-15]
MKTFDKVLFYCKPEPKEKDNPNAYHAFPLEVGAKSDYTARIWASDLQRTEPVIFEFSNEFEDVVLIDLDKRGQGGRAYQVVIKVEDKSFRVDLREDSLMDILLNSSINRGKLEGTYTFIRKSSQVHLIRVGSEYYIKAQKEKPKHEMKPIPKSELKIGHLYETRGGNQEVYLGDIYKHAVIGLKGNTVNSVPEKRMAFLRWNSWHSDQVQSFLRGGAHKEDIPMYALEVKKSHSFVIDKGKVTDLGRLDILSSIFSAVRKEFDNYYNKYESYTSNKVLANSYIPYMYEFARRLAVTTDKNEPLDYRVYQYLKVNPGGSL